MLSSLSTKPAAPARERGLHQQRVGPGREHEHPARRPVRGDPRGASSPCRRGTHVEQADVRVVLEHGTVDRPRRLGQRDHRVPGGLQGRPERLDQQPVVVAEHDPHGSRARRPMREWQLEADERAAVGPSWISSAPPQADATSERDA
jgi:hypothetical protein